jgi:hypothetical protein
VPAACPIRWSAPVSQGPLTDHPAFCPTCILAGLPRPPSRPDKGSGQLITAGSRLDGRLAGAPNADEQAAALRPRSRTDLTGVRTASRVSTDLKVGFVREMASKTGKRYKPEGRKSGSGASQSLAMKSYSPIPCSTRNVADVVPALVTRCSRPAGTGPHGCPGSRSTCWSGSRKATRIRPSRT